MMPHGGPTSPSHSKSQLLVNLPSAARLLGISLRSLQRLTATSQTPRLVRLGRRVLVPIDEWRAWVEAGCPDRSAWEEVRKDPGRPGPEIQP